jgi:RNA recognition motif-containing protein
LNLPQRKVFISGLSRIATQAEVDERRAELERAFRKYGSNHGAIAIVPEDKAYAFVELVSERQADLALQEMQDKYRLNWARLSRHEALQEERVAAEAATSDGQKKDNSDWDRLVLLGLCTLPFGYRRDTGFTTILSTTLGINIGVRYEAFWSSAFTRFRRHSTN